MPTTVQPVPARLRPRFKNNDVTYDVGITAVYCRCWASSVTEYRFVGRRFTDPMLISVLFYVAWDVKL